MLGLLLLNSGIDRSLANFCAIDHTIVLVLSEFGSESLDCFVLSSKLLFKNLWFL